MTFPQRIMESSSAAHEMTQLYADPYCMIYDEPYAFAAETATYRDFAGTSVNRVCTYYIDD